MHLQKLFTFVQQKYYELDNIITKAVNILTINKLIKLALNNWAQNSRKERKILG